MTYCARLKGGWFDFLLVLFGQTFGLLGGSALANVAVHTNQWVTTDRECWGLGMHCVITGNDTLHMEWTCHNLPSGSIPGYYHAITAALVIYSIMTLVVLSASYIALRTAIFIVLLYLASALTPPMLLLTFYQDDDRWKDADPSLGLSFWLFCVSEALHALGFVADVCDNILGDGNMCCENLDDAEKATGDKVAVILDVGCNAGHNPELTLFPWDASCGIEQEWHPRDIEGRWITQKLWHPESSTKPKWN